MTANINQQQSKNKEDIGIMKNNRATKKRATEKQKNDKSLRALAELAKEAEALSFASVNANNGALGAGPASSIWTKSRLLAGEPPKTARILIKERIRRRDGDDEGDPLHGQISYTTGTVKKPVWF